MNPPRAALGARKRWDRIARFLVETAHDPLDGHLYGPLAPSEDQLRLVGDVSGKAVLDLGCGGGEASVWLAQRGAHCTGVDFSPAQISRARGLAEQFDVTVRWLEADLKERLDAIGDCAADVCLLLNVLGYLTDPAIVFHEAFRALRPGGKLIACAGHPLARIARAEPRRITLAASYFDGAGERWEWDCGDERVELFEPYRTLGRWMNLTADAGFVVERVLEPEAVADRMPAGLPEFEVHSCVPAMLIWKARRP